MTKEERGEATNAITMRFGGRRERRRNGDGLINRQTAHGVARDCRRRIEVVLSIVHKAQIACTYDVVG